MTENQKRIEDLIELTLKKCLSYLKQEDNGSYSLIDPIELREISAHYGSSHLACALIILGQIRNDKSLFGIGKSIIENITTNWDEIRKLKDFHADFNNFALCISYEYLHQDYPDLSEKIKSILLRSNDSNHNTINWLPMRWFVNFKKNKWTNDTKYKIKINECRIKIKEATNKDGGIEDLLPKGVSYNLQYNISTVAGLQFLNCNGQNIDFSNELDYLLGTVCPDGDINYQGRGTNQIFAWGPWVYLLTSSKNDIFLSKSLGYLHKNFPLMLDNNNLMLNNFNGNERHLWWDYHYSSVYIAHFLFWLVLSKIDFNKKEINYRKTNSKSSSLKIIKKSNYFISIFDGRSRYLSEKGPFICAFWIKKYGTIMKGTFGPWQGQFGKKHSNHDFILRNFIGLLETKKNYDWSSNRFVNKLLPLFKFCENVKLKPISTKIDIIENENHLDVKFINKRNNVVVFNFPIFETINIHQKLKLFVDDNELELFCLNKYKNQYDWCKVYQSKPLIGTNWTLRIYY